MILSRQALFVLKNKLYGWQVLKLLLRSNNARVRNWVSSTPCQKRIKTEETGRMQVLAKCLKK